MVSFQSKFKDLLFRRTNDVNFIRKASRQKTQEEPILQFRYKDQKGLMFQIKAVKQKVIPPIQAFCSV